MIIDNTDKVLSWIQKSFTINSGVSGSLVGALDTVTNYINYMNNNNNVRKIQDIVDKRKLKEAKRLATDSKKVKLINNAGDFYRQFDALGDFGVGNITGAYKAADNIIKDINTTRMWITKYKNWVSNIRLMNNIVNQEQLVRLGLSILGRAVELCPKETGLLRSSGLLIEQPGEVIITFTAPYASYVHENLNIVHPIHGDRDCGGRAKFLELAAQEFFPNKTVWTEITGYGGVMIRINISGKLEYKHYGSS